MFQAVQATPSHEPVPGWPLLDHGELSDQDALRFADHEDIDALTRQAARLRDRGFGSIVTYSRKVFVPLTRLCRNVCHYCTFAQTPREAASPYLSMDEVLALAEAGKRAGCKEALLTLGEKPELRYDSARRALAALRFDSTVSYLAHVADVVWRTTGLLPHVNAGNLTPAELALLRPVSASIGIMLESASTRLCARGMPHHGSPDKLPSVRLRTIEDAGAASVPLTTGLLIGIGETRRERIEALLALRHLHRQYGHIQELIIQNFRAKPGTRMAAAAEPTVDDLRWSIAVARLVFGPAMSIQAPPNLNPGELGALVDAGVNDWGGVSPVTQDFVNPEAPWPHLDELAEATARAGKHLEERLPIYPAFVRDRERWLDPTRHAALLDITDAEGFPRTDDWCTGAATELPQAVTTWIDHRDPPRASSAIRDLVRRLQDRDAESQDIEALFAARGPDLGYLCRAADELCASVHGRRVSFIVNCNINYTNICGYRCRFCAFSKGRVADDARDPPYLLAPEDIAQRCREAHASGVTEVCLQGGIHPEFDGHTYLAICRAVKQAVPEMHVHAFSPLEIWHGAATLGISVAEFLTELKAAGLGSLPGTAAEILDDELRQILCADKITTGQWLEVIGTAHGLGIPSTATILFGHIDQPRHWAAHLLAIKSLQRRSGGFTEFVPLPFVAHEAPIYRRGLARRGPTFREVVLMHAIARLVLHPEITNIQGSWVKLGPAGLGVCLHAGVNDLGGTLMNESISRTAGAVHGQAMTVEEFHLMAAAAGRTPWQRTTCYQPAASASANP